MKHAGDLRPAVALRLAVDALRWLLPPVAVLLTLAVMWTLAGAPRPSPAATPYYLMFAACGLVSGFLSGLLGIGGALVVVPVMYLLLPGLGVPVALVPHTAVGSSLVAMVPSACAAARAQYRKGALDSGWLRRLGPGMLIGAAGGACLALSLRGPVLAMLFAVQSLYYGWGLLRPPPSRGWRRGVTRFCGLLPAVLVGPVVGAFCACAGMGGGSLTVPYMLSRGEVLLRAVATSSALNLCISLGGAAAFWFHGGDGAVVTAPAICWPAALLVGGCAVLAVKHGVALAHRLPVALFRRLLGLVTLLGAAVLTGRTLADLL